LPRPTLPPTFDGGSAATLAKALENQPNSYLNRSAGSPQDLSSGGWFHDQMTALGLAARFEDFRATIPGTGTVTLRNVLAVVPGRSPQTIVVTAHRDNGTNGFVLYRDNAAGTAALIQIAA